MNLEKIRKEYEEKLLELSYRHDNEITLAMDDIWNFIQEKLEEVEIKVIDGLYESLEPKVYRIEGKDKSAMVWEDFVRAFLQYKTQTLQEKGGK